MTNEKAIELFHKLDRISKNGGFAVITQDHWRQLQEFDMPGELKNLVFDDHGDLVHIYRSEAMRAER